MPGPDTGPDTGLVAGPVTVRVPATSANLGPGYDALGLALALYDEVTVEALGGGDRPVIAVEGEGADTVSLGPDHLVHRSLVRGFEAMGLPAPVVRLHCRNAIPHGRGLGSSSAAIVAGLAAARSLVVDGRERWSDEALFSLAADLEGHPDNVAPAVFGGFTIAWGNEHDFHAVRLDVTSPLAPTAFIPSEVLETKVARSLLPETVPHRDAARNAGRSALLVAALTGRPDLLMAATEDWLHQDYRAPAMPGSADLLARLRAAGHAAVVSGAGPTVLALVVPGREDDAAALAPPGWRALRLAIDRTGVRQI